MASPNKPATDRVVIFTPSIAGRRTVSVVISSSIVRFSQSFDPDIVQNRMRNTGINLLGTLFLQERRQSSKFRLFRSNHPPSARSALDFANHGHGFDFRGAFAPFRHNGQVRPQAPANRHGPFSTHPHPGSRPPDWECSFSADIHTSRVPHKDDPQEYRRIPGSAAHADPWSRTRLAPAATSRLATNLAVIGTRGWSLRSCRA